MARRPELRRSKRLAPISQPYEKLDDPKNEQSSEPVSEMTGDSTKFVKSTENSERLEFPTAKKRIKYSAVVQEKVEKQEEESKVAVVDDDKKPASRKRRSISEGKSREAKRRAVGKVNSKNENPGSQEEKEQDSGEEDDVDAVGDDGSREYGKASTGNTSNRASTGRGPEKDRTCPHCEKIMSTKAGLKYHLDNFVCRIDQCDDPEVLAKVNRKRGRSRPGTIGPSSTKRFRGPIKERTCPNCKFVFTSTIGCNYHVKHKVCQPAATKKSKKKDPRVGMGILEPGSQFVTQYGVVEVVKDDRATPMADLPENLADKFKTYGSAKARIESQNARIMELVAANSRVRRRKVNALYQNGNLSKKTIFGAYFDSNPFSRCNKQILETLPLPKDPALLDNFCPDRIVECILLSDRRNRVSPSGEAISTNTADERQSKARTHLFLQRRLLLEPYNEGLPTYDCSECGRQFGSYSGLKYHVTNKTCVSKNASEGKKREDRSENIDELAEAISLDENKLLALLPRTMFRRLDKSLRKKRNIKKQMGMYPEVLLSLGFKLVKTGMDIAGEIELPTVADRGENTCEDSLEAAYFGDSAMPANNLAVDQPGDILEHLRETLKGEQREYERTAANQKHGSMYTAVFKSLGFKKPRAGRKEAPQRTTRRRRRKTKEAETPPKPLPPIIDTRALADEVDCGRYPSMNRNKEENHSDVCVLCKEGGELVCCDFCNNAEHIKCIRKKFTVKDPEPEDDFMCHKCIQTVLMRRNRAEKRRIMKKKREEERQEKEALEDVRRNPGIKPGMEYPYMAARGQEFSELVEMLQDAQTRLKQSLATSRMNNVRRKAMGCFYNAKL